MKSKKVLLFCLLNVFILSFTFNKISAQDRYEATLESLDSHEIPQWYKDAKLGLSLHWGVYAVPAWAPRLSGISYAEWYGNRMKDQNNPTYQYHIDNYGSDFTYDDFELVNYDPHPHIKAEVSL